MYEDMLRHRTPRVKSDEVRELYDATPAAPDVSEIIPRGKYEADWIAIKVGESGNGTPRVVLTFEITEGEYAGRRIWWDLYLTQKAIPRTKRELAKLGIESSEHWTRPVPHWVRCSLQVVVETADDQKQRNKIVKFEVIAFDAEQPDPFAPTTDGGVS